VDLDVVHIHTALGVPVVCALAALTVDEGRHRYPIHWKLIR